MTTVATPDTSPASQEALRSEYIQRAKDLVPLLRSNARRTDEERRLPQENIDALEKSGILRASRPVQHGGIEMDEITKFHVFSELARGCGSTGWVATLLSDASFLVSLFPDEVQAEVFADPNTHTTATLIPAGRAERDGSGFRVTGRWPFQHRVPSRSVGSGAGGDRIGIRPARSMHLPDAILGAGDSR